MRKRRFKVNKFKVGDLAYVGIEHSRLGVITKFERGRNHKGYARYYATVFVFKTTDSITVHPGRLTKVEERGHEI